MTLSQSDRAAIADALRDAHRTGRAASLPAVPETVAEGYAVQRALTERRREFDGATVGYKLGFTNEAIQRELGVPEPAFGRLFSDAVGRPDRVDPDAFVAPRAEPELAVRLDGSLDTDATPADARDALGAVLPAIELVDSRTGDWSPTPAVAVADNALGSALVVGPERDPGSVPPLAEIEATVSAGGTERSGRGDAVLGDPLTAVAWLAERRDGLPAGTLVSTGSLTETVRLPRGGTVCARFGGLGRVAVDVAGG